MIKLKIIIIISCVVNIIIFIINEGINIKYTIIFSINITISIIVQSINIKNIIICATKIIIFIIIESINTKKYYYLWPQRHIGSDPVYRQGSSSTRSRHVMRKSDCAP